MRRQAFTFADIERECHIETDCYQLDGKALGCKVFVPEALQQQYPFNASAYGFLQELRKRIFEFGTIEFPDLPVNKTNYTLAQRSPKEHEYSPNPYMTDICQFPHQDTPPYPTAFWLPDQRRYFATWLMSLQGVKRFHEYCRANPALGIEDLHRDLVPESLQQGIGLLVNQTPGLILIDNSNHRSLYHARTCNFAAVADHPGYKTDAPMYAFNEEGLLHYIDELDIRRGDEGRDPEDAAQVRAFMADEVSFS